MCRVCYGPSLSCAEFAMCRVVPKSVEVLDVVDTNSCSFLFKLNSTD